MKKKTKLPLKSKKLTDIGYKIGNIECDINSNECLAKIVVGQMGSKLYYIKYGMPPSGLYGPCNPVGLGFDKSHLTRKDEMSGKPYYEFKQVSLQAFEIYKKFLMTSNEGFINQLNRIEIV